MASANHTLTQERLKELVSYSPDTGLFTRIARTANSTHIGEIAGSPNKRGYIDIRIDGFRCYGHRLAWLYVHGRWPEVNIDHINGVKGDNRIDNLRECNQSQNHQNRAIQKNNKTGLIGAHVDKKYNRFYSRIAYESKSVHLGYFDTPEEAHAAYVEAKARLHTFQPTIRT